MAVRGLLLGIVMPDDVDRSRQEGLKKGKVADRAVDYATPPSQASIDDARLETAGALTVVWGILLILSSCLVSPMLAVPISEQMVMPSPAPYGDTGRITGDLSYLTWVIMAGLLVIAGLTVASGRCLIARRHRNFSMWVAMLNCVLLGPGTALGVYTMIVLCTRSVREEYELTEREGVERY